MSAIQQQQLYRDPWFPLKQYTAARIALGRTGAAQPLQATLDFKLAHAHARDAVYSIMDKPLLHQQLDDLGLQYAWLHSKAADRHQYLQRPDYGRQLNDDSINRLKGMQSSAADVCITIADGLSATAVNNHAAAVLRCLLPMLQQSGLTIAPVCIVEQGRVAVGDETGSLLHARLSMILIGERPGLSSPDSLGVYLTYAPARGTTDERRNCISNIRPEGLHYNKAAEKILYLVKEALRLQLSGVQLKDNAGLLDIS